MQFIPLPSIGFEDSIDEFQARTETTPLLNNHRSPIVEQPHQMTIRPPKGEKGVWPMFIGRSRVDIGAGYAFTQLYVEMSTSGQDSHENNEQVNSLFETICKLYLKLARTPFS